MEWDPKVYAKFGGLRLRPALDLLAQVPELPEGSVVDLGCGNGAVGAALKARFGRVVLGVDNAETMLVEAAKTGAYDGLELVDIAEWQGVPALIFSNAALHWLPEHTTLFPRLAGMLPEGGVLAVQMPRQCEAPSHVLLREVAVALFPERFNYAGYVPAVAAPGGLAEILRPMGALNIWETSYFQRLGAGEGHPVRRFTQSTAAGPILAKLSDGEQARFLAAYDEALAEAYPLAADGGCDFPFLRQFIVMVRGG